MPEEANQIRELDCGETAALCSNDLVLAKVILVHAEEPTQEVEPAQTASVQIADNEAKLLRFRGVCRLSEILRPAG